MKSYNSLTEEHKQEKHEAAEFEYSEYEKKVMALERKKMNKGRKKRKTQEMIVPSARKIYVMNHGVGDFLSCFDVSAIAHKDWENEIDEVQVAFHRVRAEIMRKVEEGKFVNQDELNKALKLRNRTSHPAAPARLTHAYNFFRSDRCIGNNKEAGKMWSELKKNGEDKSYKDQEAVDKIRLHSQITEYCSKIGLVLSGYKVVD